MKKTLYFIFRAGSTPKVMPLDEHSDGTLWYREMPLLDGQAPEFLALGQETVSDMVRGKRFGEIPAACFARIGTSATGLEVVTQADYRARAMAARTPAQVERDRINGLYAKARARREAQDDSNISDYYRIMGEADAALKAWREQYPEDAKAEQRAELIAQAEHEESLAVGALTYDADGWLNETERQKGHDEHMAKAAAIRERAAAL